MVASRDNPLVFFDSLTIRSTDGPKPFRACMGDFQRDRFRSIAPALVSVARGERPAIGRHWWEATKGASKDSDLARCILWLVASATRPLLCQVGAADQDQADELRKAAKDDLALNPWLSEHVEIHNWRIVGKHTGAVCEIEAADVGGSHGARPDVLIINELSHITKQEFAENLRDNAAKVPNGLVVIATNAGFTGTWQYRWRDLAMDSDRWYFHKWDRPSPWLDPEEIKEAEARNSRSRYQRLWWGVWASGAGDALDMDVVEACINKRARPLIGNEGYTWLGGVDIGIKHDRTGIVVIGADLDTMHATLAFCRSFSPGGPMKAVDMLEVEQCLEHVVRTFPGITIGYDPSQCEGMGQSFRRRGVNMFPVHPSSKNCHIMASALLQVFRNRTIELYPDKQLILDLGKLNIVQKSYGYKLESPSDESGHADVAQALAIAISGLYGTFEQGQLVYDDGLGESLLD